MHLKSFSLLAGLFAGCCALTSCSRTESSTPEAEVKPHAGRIEQGAAASVSADYKHILIDQFGYRPSDTKVAVIRTPHAGYDANDKFIPGTSYQIRRADNGDVVFSGMPTAWKGGSVESSSGDSGWWFDFSAVTAPGRYFVYDVTKKLRSATFLVDAQPFKAVLKAAMRVYFYQRSGFAKRAPFAEACWRDDPAYLGKNQETQARDVFDQDNSDKARDVSGGWFDAGDTNKYVTFAVQPVHQLLTAYQENPAAFTDDFDIPESGNGLPDVIDEVKWETDWLKKMQSADGSVALKVGEIKFGDASPPSRDTTQRFYIPSCTSATIAAAGMFAHAAYVYQQFPALANDASDLRMRAINAWQNYTSIPNKQTKCDTGIVHAGNADLTAAEQAGLAVEAAIYLYAATHDPNYQTYLKAHYQDTRPYHDMGWSRYNADQGDALLFYSTLNDADGELKASLVADKLKDVNAGNQIYGFNPDDDLYRAFLHDAQYHWGSNGPRANYGNTNLDVARYVKQVSDTAPYRDRALEILHYFHGVNPFGMVYLSNMYAYGATSSANEIYHSWFRQGTKWSDALTSECGPAPGYVPGGPNASAKASGVPAYLTPPVGQPPQKAYKDWNGGGAEASWTITEPGIYFQSAYVKLLSKFVQ